MLKFPLHAAVAMYIASLIPSAIRNSPIFAPIGPVKAIRAAPATT